MVQKIPAAMVAADVATQAELDVVGGVASGAASAAAAAAGKLSGDLVQTATSQTGAVASGTTVVPLDDTIPQITEGNEYMTLAVTPTSASNYLEIEVHAMLATSAVSGFMTAALFQDSTANALAAATQYVSSNNAIVHVSFKHRMLAGTVAATTFRVRCGGNNAGTTTINGQAGARIFGGVFSSSITVREIKA